MSGHRTFEVRTRAGKLTLGVAALVAAPGLFLLGRMVGRFAFAVVGG